MSERALPRENKNYVDTLVCLLAMSVGCFALNGYDMQRRTKIYSWRRIRLSSSSRIFAFVSTSSLVIDGDGDAPLSDGVPVLLSYDDKHNFHSKTNQEK